MLQKLFIVLIYMYLSAKRYSGSVLWRPWSAGWPGVTGQYPRVSLQINLNRYAPLSGSRKMRAPGEKRKLVLTSVVGQLVKDVTTRSHRNISRKKWLSTRSDKNSAGASCTSWSGGTPTHMPYAPGLSEPPRGESPASTTWNPYPWARSRRTCYTCITSVNWASLTWIYRDCWSGMRNNSTQLKFIHFKIRTFEYHRQTSHQYAGCLTLLDMVD